MMVAWTTVKAKKQTDLRSIVKREPRGFSNMGCAVGCKRKRHQGRHMSNREKRPMTILEHGWW